MMAEGASLDYFLWCQDQPKMDLILRWGNAEQIEMQPLVIFPRVHVARNIRGFNRNPFDLIAMRCEQRAQTACGVEGQQFIPVGEIDQDRMPAATFVLGL